jgi:hypothetical protein
LTGSPAHPLAELYARLACALAGRRWYLFGARAAIHYGSVRGTVDVDIALALDEESPDRLLARLADAGFALRIPEWRELFDDARVLLLIDSASGIELDIVLTGQGIEKGFHERARSGQFGSATLPVISPEDLVIGKVLAGRPQDLQDVEAVLAVQEVFDADHVRELLLAIERALGRSDLVEVFERLAARARGG